MEFLASEGLGEAERGAGGHTDLDLIGRGCSDVMLTHIGQQLKGLRWGNCRNWRTGAVQEHTKGEAGERRDRKG